MYLNSAQINFVGRQKKEVSYMPVKKRKVAKKKVAAKRKTKKRK